ncbi:MAG: LLM class flavin-dependent oxidoreductase [Microthrixaceae bacterium]|nr:LLM class flavin-dependent oxidoreductase [Microthrixaceae bacterium]
MFANDYRHPALLAKETATIDRLSGGRLEVGLGAGWMLTDYHASGIPLDPPSVRIERLDEAPGSSGRCGRARRSLTAARTTPSTS